MEPVPSAGVILVDANGLVASRPGKPLFEDVSVTVSSGDRLAVVGLNGTGKSTLLGVLAGTVEPESGDLRRGRGARVTFLDQTARLPAGSVREVAGGAWEAEAILDRLGMGDHLDSDVTTLSGGQAKRVALARALVSVGEDDDADLLILDEPTNHLDMDAIAWLEDRLAQFRGGLILVTHDRHVLDRVTTRILELDRGTGYVHDGGYASYLEARADRVARAAAAEKVRRNLARSELAWLRRGAPARTRKPKAHVASARALVEARAEAPERPDELPLHEVTQTPRLGNTVVELHGVADGYGDRTLFAGVDLALDPRERLGVVGANGSGKSTLLDVIAERRSPREGRVVHGSTVRIGYYDQRGAELPLDERVRDVVAGPTRKPDWTDAALLDRFWFNTDAQWAPVRLLSGGERRRLQLVLVLRQAPNVLLLDEPTNDLDLDTLRALEDLLETWPGALVVVSHDRAFLERTVDDVLVLDGKGSAGRIPGGYAAYEAARRSARSPGRSNRSTPAAGAPSRARTGSGKAGADGRAATTKRRTPSTLRHMMAKADKRLASLHDQQTELEAAVAGASSDPAELRRLGEEMARVGDEVATVEAEWLALAEEAEDQGLVL
jgi:ABC transport system ATP-binding/permease protein